MKYSVLVVTFFLGINLCFAGEIVCWGYEGENGEIADCPVGDDFVQISAGGWQAAALRENGSIEVWGQEWSHGSNPGNTEVFNVPEGNFVQIASGFSHCLALNEDGSLTAWGNNLQGQCDAPQGNDFIAVGCGASHSMALKSDGTVLAWGYNYYGQCDVPEGYIFRDIGTGFNSQHSLAVNNLGQLIGWGANNFGELDFTDVYNIQAFVSGQGLTGVVYLDGSLEGWGADYFQQLDFPNVENIIDVSFGMDHSIGLDENGQAYVWGTEQQNNGIFDIPQGYDFVSVSAGGFFNVALTPEPTSILLFVFGTVISLRKNK